MLRRRPLFPPHRESAPSRDVTPDASFVAREVELSALERLFDGASDRPRVAYVHGPPGIGKSTLLRRFVAICRQRARLVTRVDGRDFEPTPEGLARALASAAAGARRTRSEDALRALSRLRRPHVVVIDAYEPSDPLDRWLHDTLLPGLPPAAAVVIASRRLPTSEWLAPPPAGSPLEVLGLRALDPQAARALLVARGAPSHASEAAIALTHGHPLALALVADVLARDPAATLDFASTPDIVQVLVRRFVGDTTDPDERAAIEAAAIARVVDEPALAALLPGADVGRTFRWLASRAFVDPGVAGLRPHELARAVLAADLRWRASDRYAALVTRYIDHCIERFMRGQHTQRVGLDVLFAHRAWLSISDEWDVAAELRADVARPEDHAAICAMVELHEGPESAALAARWIERGMEVQVVRSRDGTVRSFVGFLALERARPADLQADPATRAAWRYAKKTLRAGERVNLVRWWMTRDKYQDHAPENLVLGSLMMRKNFAPGLALSLWPVTDEAGWTAINDAAMHLDRLRDADFEHGGRRHAVFGLDFRKQPMALFLADMTRRLVAGPGAAPAPERSPVLTRAEFDRALRAALKHLHDADRLALNPLVRSRLVTARAALGAEPAARAVVLRRLIEGAAATLAEVPRHAGPYAALRHTFLVPAVKQEVAADLAGVPFATYRSHLARAVALIGGRLWTQELGAEAPD